MQLPGSTIEADHTEHASGTTTSSGPCRGCSERVPGFCATLSVRASRPVACKHVWRESIRRRGSYVSLSGFFLPPPVYTPGLTHSPSLRCHLPGWSPGFYPPPQNPSCLSASSLYPKLTGSVGFHADTLTNLGPYTTIASLSLGTPRVFKLRPTANELDAGPLRTYEMELGHNSLVLMTPGCQERYKHT